MRVITLTEPEFETCCRRFAEACHANGAAPDVLVGIITGGALVAGKISKYFPKTRHLDLCLQRSTTRLKGPWFSGIVKILPRFLQNWLRMAESNIVSISTTRKDNRTVELPDDLRLYMNGNPSASILLVDDAVDSGNTMKRVVETLAKAYPLAKITTAAITVTTLHPVIEPDIALYRNRTLIRFPWSSDAK